MPAQFVFTGVFDTGGVFRADDPWKYSAVGKKLAGKRGEVVIRKEKSKRSLDMNAYLHSTNGPFRLLAEHFGEDLAGIKYALSGECFGWVRSQVVGRDVPMKPHTSEWTVEDSTYFVEWVIPWAAQNYGVIIPLPNEVL